MDRSEAKRVAVLESAGPVFMRFGYAQTKMGLIAEAAGMSRPALYLLFSSKEDVFSAVVLWMNDNLIEEIRRAIRPISDFEERMFLACDTWSSSVYDVHAQSHAAEDMDNLEFPAVRALYQNLCDFVLELLSERNSPMAKRKDKAIIANMIVHALRGCRLGAASKEEMHRMNRILIASICCSGLSARTIS